MTTTARTVAAKIRETAARLVEDIDPKDGWDEAGRRKALQGLLAFAVTSNVVVVGIPTSAPRNFSKSVVTVWDMIARQAATTAIDLATEDLGVTGTIDSTNPYSVTFTLDR